MPKLTDAQLVVLSAAAKSADRKVLPVPKSLKLKAAATSAVLRSLLKHGLIAERTAKRLEKIWRETPGGERLTLEVTNKGLRAIGVEIFDRPSGGEATARPKRSKHRKQNSRLGGRTGSEAAATAGHRDGTKQALLIDLLRRERGATLAEAVAATGWQAHSVRGAISGALKKRLGLTVTSEQVEGRGRVYQIAAR